MNCACAALRCGLGAAVLALVAACAAPGPHAVPVARDRQVLEASSAATLAYELGNYEQARTLYRRALMRARAIDAADQAADAAYNLAMSEIGLQNYEVAERMLRQAEYDAARGSSAAADIRLLRAKVAYLRERLPQALALANDVFSARATPGLVLQATILRGQVFCDLRDLPAARAELQAAARLAGSSQSALAPAVEADINKLQGTIARLEGRWDVAARFFDAEVELLRAAHRHRDMAYALARAAEAQLAAGFPALAADRFFLAARSLAAQGEPGTGKAFAVSSQGAAETAGDEDAHARARKLLADINQRAAP